MTTLSLLKTVLTSGDYYASMNIALKAINGDYHMLHYPFHIEETDSFAKAQVNLIDYCIGKLPCIENKKVLDIGCGNGVVALYLAENYNIGYILGVDLNAGNIKIAIAEKNRRNIAHADFVSDNAENLKSVKSNSFDVIINIESAFHYTNKELFLKEIHRILKPGDHFIIADILTTRKRRFMLKKWKKKMHFNHWTLDEYREAFDSSELKLISEDDISQDVILGYKVYRNYMKDFSFDAYFGGLLLKLFFVINVRLNSYLLRKKRKYFVFYGQKQA
jgi:2-polyprenyl-3-methyl-5-hydroxy-6-metoxy-1,4-benzoquinol methylase